MSRKTIVNRKFLEEQVRKTLLEFDPEEIGRNPKPEEEEEEDLDNTDKLPGDEDFGAVNVDSLEYSEPVVRGEETLDLKMYKFGVGAAKEIIDVPELVYKKLERNVEFKGSYTRQTLKRAGGIGGIKSQAIKEFFSLFRLVRSATTPITTFRADWEAIFDPDLYEIHPALIEIIEGRQLPSKRVGRKRVPVETYEGFYLSLNSFFTATKTSKLILKDRKKIFKNIKDTDTSLDQFLISCFKRDDASDMSIEYEDVYDFLSQVKEELLTEMQASKYSIIETLTFLVISEIDPTGSRSFVQYRHQILDQIEKDPDLKPWNIVRAIGQMSIAAHIEKRINKRPMTFWRSLFVGFAVALALDWGDNNLRGNWVSTSYGEIEDITKLLKHAENIIELSCDYGGASKRVQNQVRELCLQAVDIVRTQFKESMESEGFMMSMPDRVGAFEKVSQQLEYASTYFDPTNFSITKDNCPALQRDIHYFKNALIQIYQHYQVSLAEYSPLEENIITDIEKIINFDYKLPGLKTIVEGPDADPTVRKIGGVTFKIAEVDSSGLTDEDIEALIETYGITERNIYSKTQKILGGNQANKEPFKTGIGKFAIESLSKGGQSAGQYRADFIREIEVLKSPYSQISPVKGQKYLSKNYARESRGMYIRYAGTGGFIRSTYIMNCLFAPALHASDTGDPNTNFSNLLLGYTMDKRRIAAKGLFAVSYGWKSDPSLEWRAEQDESPDFGRPFQMIMGTQRAVWPGRQYGVIGKTPKIYLKLDNAITKINNEGYGGKLLMILALHHTYWSVINRVFEAGKRAEDKVFSLMAAGKIKEAERYATVLFKFIYAWAELDYYTSQNGISFFRTKHKYGF